MQDSAYAARRVACGIEHRAGFHHAHRCGNIAIQRTVAAHEGDMLAHFRVRGSDDPAGVETVGIDQLTPHAVNFIDELCPVCLLYTSRCV